MQWLGLTGLLVILSLIIAGGDHRPPEVLQDAPAPTGDRDGSPFSLAALRERLPEQGIRRVREYITYYQEHRRRGLAEGLARSTRYLGAFKRIFREVGLPEELAYLPLIESGFMEHAISPAEAVGVWQFIEETGRRYDLESNRWWDQKRDPILSAKAAARYFAHLHERFGEWELALAAYNAGEGTVAWARRTSRRAGRPQDFWHMAELPQETRNYVPAFLAAMLIAKNPKAFGFDEIEFMPELVFERIKVKPGVRLTELARRLEMKKQTLAELNPELLAGITPPGREPYPLRVPAGTYRQLSRRLAKLERTPVDWILYRVDPWDTVQRLASRFRTEPARIRKVNQIEANRELEPGRFVIIPL